jgi:hypothetical protein
VQKQIWKYLNKKNYAHNDGSWIIIQRTKAYEREEKPHDDGDDATVFAGLFTVSGKKTTVALMTSGPYNITGAPVESYKSACWVCWFEQALHNILQNP